MTWRYFHIFFLLVRYSRNVFSRENNVVDFRKLMKYCKYLLKRIPIVREISKYIEQNQFSICKYLHNTWINEYMFITYFYKHATTQGENPLE